MTIEQTGHPIIIESQDGDKVELKAQKQGGEIVICLTESIEAICVGLLPDEARALGEWLLRAVSERDAP